MNEYHTRVKDATVKIDKLTRSHKRKYCLLTYTLVHGQDRF